MKLFLVTLIVCLITGSDVVAVEDDLFPIPPQGWRVPPKETMYNLGNWRAESKDWFIRAFGDYNGDGVRDHAALYVNEESLTEGLWVYLSGTDASRKWLLLTAYPGESASLFMGIETIGPGRYETIMCLNHSESGKCISEININHDAILFFRHMSASSIFWWDGSQKTFQRFWYTD